jgi:hypothetical protein
MNTQRCLAMLVAAAAVGLAAPVAAGPPQPAGPEVRYADAADDGYRTPVGPALLPDPTQSDPALDIREVAFGPSRKGRYAASMTFSGAPTVGSTYVSAGYFRGQDCQMYHFLRLGQRAYATLFCGAGDERRQLPTVWGDVVEAEGSTVYASFSNRSLPAELEAEGSTLTGLFSWSCPSGGPPEGNGCHDVAKVDVAEDPAATYALRGPTS